MKTSIIADLHKKTADELNKQIAEARTELAKARFEKRAGVGRANLRELRDNLARLLTIASEKLESTK